MDYWKECVESALEEAGLKANTEQIQLVADSVKIAHENYSFYTGEFNIPNPLEEEVNKLKVELKKEKSKTVCSACNSSGRVTIPGPYHSSNSECYECYGKGFKYA